MKKAITLFVFVFSLMCAAADGDLDTSFGTNGMVITSIGDSNPASAVALQPDDKIVAAGQATVAGGLDFALARYNSNGSLDVSFGVNGLVTTNFGGAFDEGRAVVIQPDGKIIVAGSSNAAGDFDFALVRYNPNGSLDTSFGTNGLVTTDLGGSFDQVFAALLQPDGKIIAIGSSNGSGDLDFALARYNIDGSLDSSFGTNGVVTTNFGGGTDQAGAAVLQPDGKIIAVGQAGDLDFALARYNPDGSLDTSFGTNGLVTTDLGGVDRAHGVVLYPDGKSVAVGTSNFTGTFDFALARYNSNGSLDVTFGTNGVVITNLPGEQRAFAAVLQPDGKVIAAGRSDAGGDNDFALARYTFNGSLDTSFGINGVVTTTFVSDDEILAALVQADGKIVAAGGAGVGGISDFALARYLIPSIEISSLARDMRAKYFLLQKNHNLFFCEE